ncbi:MAG: riboflavin synthase [Solirubrobacterales bacterium]|jgi:riboflavin synthase|nr:riboflavin synthase [Solirubrobacterales bacterium]
MFSGLVQDLGRVERIEVGDDGARIRIATKLASQISLGDSVAVNGCCLTATTVDDSGFTADAMQQTLDLTSLGGLDDGAQVNLELALRADQRLGGHIVQGHVDGTAEVIAERPDGFSRRLRISVPENLGRYVIPQGSITIEGVSLTVADCDEGWAEVALIPETRERTNLGTLETGTTVNIECDVIAKYVERMVSPYVRGSDSHTDR